MKKYPILIGSVVKSLAGRDEGRLSIVSARISDEFVLTVNGALRTMDRPKKKRIKHLKPTGTVVTEFARRMEDGSGIEDHEIRSWLKKEEENLVQV